MKDVGGNVKKEQKDLNKYLKDQRTLRQRHPNPAISVDTSKDLFQWVAELVPEPFTLDEIEEEVWTMEDDGRVPTGTWKRLHGSSGVVEHGWSATRN